MTTQQTLQTEEYKQTELGELPKEWEVRIFTKCIEHIKTPKKIKFYQPEYKKIGKYAIVHQGQELLAGYHDDESRLYQGNIPIIIFGDVSRTFKYIDFPFSLGADGSKIISPLKGLFDVKFFYYYMNTLDIPSRGYNRHYKDLKEKLIIIPPLPEQQKIAYILSAIQQAIEKSDRVINSLKELKRSAMKHLFTYGAVSFEDAGKVKLKETEIGAVPAGWEVVKIAEVFEVQQGKQLSARESKEGKIKVPFLRTSNLVWEKVDISEAKLDKMYFTEKELERLKLKKNDILVCEGGDVGRTALWKGEIEICAYQNHIHRLRPFKQKSYDPLFFVWWIEHAILNQGMYVQIALRTTIPNLSASKLKNFDIPKPNITEQERISQFLYSIVLKIEAQERKKQSLKTLFNSLLKELMTGKTRVKDLRIEAETWQN